MIRRGLLLVSLVVVLAGPAVAQDGAAPARARFSLGVEGFTTRLGFDLTDDQGVMAAGLDLGNLGSESLRLRGLGEVGFGSGSDTYVIGADLMVRLLPDRTPVVPYVAAGPALFTAEDCSTFTACPKVWFQVSLGFEIWWRRAVNWLVEYRAEDMFRRHRVFLGLTMRRSG